MLPRLATCLLCKKMHVWNSSIQGKLPLAFFCYVLLHNTSRLTISKVNIATNVPCKLSENKNTSFIIHMFSTQMEQS